MQANMNFTNKHSFCLKFWTIHKCYEAEPSMNAGASEYKVSFAFLFTKVVLLLSMPSPIVQTWFSKTIFQEEDHNRKDLSAAHL